MQQYRPTTCSPYHFFSLLCPLLTHEVVHSDVRSKLGKSFRDRFSYPRSSAGNDSSLPSQRFVVVRRIGSYYFLIHDRRLSHSNTKTLAETTLVHLPPFAHQDRRRPSTCPQLFPGICHYQQLCHSHLLP